MGKTWTEFIEELNERTAPLPKATAFAITYSYAGKDHKFVSKLTDIGGKVDKKKKEVRFDFDSASARTKFRKKNKEVLSSLNESVELDEAWTADKILKVATLDNDLKTRKPIKIKKGRYKSMTITKKGSHNKYRDELNIRVAFDPNSRGDGKEEYEGIAKDVASYLNKKGINESVKEEAPVNSAGDGSRIAGLGDEPPVRKKKKKLDGRTKEFKEKTKALANARLKREKVKIEKKYGFKLGGGY